MADLRVSYNALTDEFDFDICRGTVFWDNGMQTAVMLSLFTDARALDDDEIPDGTNDRRGWWGESLAFDGIQFGSRRWLLTREKQQDVVLRKLEEYDSEALKWMLDTGVATRIDVSAEHAGPEAWLETIRIWRNGDANPFEFAWLFERIERQTCKQKFEQPPKYPPLDGASLNVVNGDAFNLFAITDATLPSIRPMAAATLTTGNDFNQSMIADVSTPAFRVLQIPQLAGGDDYTAAMQADVSVVGTRKLSIPSVGDASAFNKHMVQL